ncbi:MAG: hypothetical protein K2N34_06235 [Lachnospiraceae bacterium]|nr:hypothetical protein [Lachnospiraceae bacterium]
MIQWSGFSEKTFSRKENDMAYLAVDADGTEWIFDKKKPTRNDYPEFWLAGRFNGASDYYVQLPHGSIAKLIGRELTWNDEPVEI